MMEPTLLKSWVYAYEKRGYATCYCAGSGKGRVDYAGLVEVFKHLRECHGATEDQLLAAFGLSSALADLLPQYEDAIVEAESAQRVVNGLNVKRAQLSARCTELGLTQQLLDRVRTRVYKRLKEAK